MYSVNQCRRLLYSAYAESKSFRKGAKWIELGGAHTLGIYMIQHLFIRLLVRLKIFWGLSSEAWIVIPVCALLIFIVSFGITVVLKRIPVVRDTIL